MLLGKFGGKAASQFSQASRNFHKRVNKKNVADKLPATFQPLPSG